MRVLQGSWGRVLVGATLAALSFACTAAPSDPPAAAATAAVPAAKVKPRPVTAAERAALPHVVTRTTGPLALPNSGPTPVIVDVGEDCLEYRYSEASHCAGDVPLDNCQAATSDGDCGITPPFVLTNVWCAEANTNELQKWHVYCQGYVPSGPLPTPQCPDGHVMGVYGQDCAGSCTQHCADICIGGYCTGGGYGLCYDQYQPECDCGVAQCPCTGPDC